MTALSPNDPLGAFLPGAAPKRQGAAGGPLSGITFAAKDIYDVAGSVTGCGNPDWARTHAPAERDAWAVAALLGAGADLAGKTISDELAYSLNGRNAHYGTPTNVNAPGRIPGGSSSGSAAAVAGGLVDTALGSDTGGSIRIPASYCGLFGLRPTHGRLSLDGVMPLAPSFDTVGWFTREAELLVRVGEVLLGESPRVATPPSALHIAEDAFALMTPDTAGELAPRVRELEARLGGAQRLSVAEPEGFEAIMRAFRLIQAREIQAQHRAWIEATRPRFGPEVAERFTWALSISEAEAAPCHDLRDAVTRRLSDLLGADGVLCLPTAPGIAPRLDASAAELVDHRTRVLGMTALAGLSGLPQVTLPLAQYQGCPLGLSLIGPRGGDAMLLSLAVSLAR